MSKADSQRMKQQSKPKNGSGTMFNQIANRYDLLNRIMSFGIDIRWRNEAISALQLQPGEQILDIATGTADFSLQIARRHKGVRIVGLDPSKGMLTIAKKKVAQDFRASISLIEGDAQSLPFFDHSFDAIGMAFGIRNVPNRISALKEIRRVLKVNGRAVILELSDPPPGIFQKLTKFYIRKIIPWLGGLLSSSHEYNYLQQSIAYFPPAEEFAALIKNCGLETLFIKSLTFGTCNLYLIKPAE